MQPEVSRRRLLQALSAAVVVLPFADPPRVAAVTAREESSDAVRLTLEAWSDTIVPGERRSPDDRAVAGAAAGPGAVQAGAVDMMHFPPVGLAPALPALAAALNAEAVRYAVSANVVPGPAVPPFVALPFEHRTALALELLESDRGDRLAWYGVAAVATLAFHTAGHLSTAEAVRSGHPGLAWIRFPEPDSDGLWRYPDFSYRRRLADLHPLTTASGNPA